MNHQISLAQGAAMAAISTISTVLGWRGWLAILWIVSMCLDYLTGSVAAAKSGDWNSARAREGLYHKGGMLAVVLVAVLLDLLIKLTQQSGTLPLPVEYNAALMPITMACYTVTELGSTLENAASMGATIPTWLRKALKATQESVNSAADQAAD